EDQDRQAFLERITDHVEEHVDLDELLAHAVAGREETNLMKGEPPAESEPPVTDGVVERIPRPVATVAVARDAAFSFYYQDNLDVLQEEGAKLVFFSPLDGEALPTCDALYLGGGYPELYAGRLASNDRLRRELQDAAGQGLRIYGECGGYLYLGRSIEYEGVAYSMAGALPTETKMTKRRLRLGYVEALGAAGHPLAEHTFPGHLFHYSSTTGSSRPAYQVRRRDEWFEDGWSNGQIIASYVHLHFRGSRPIARWLVRGEPGMRTQGEEEQECRQ
ncbi:MAG TPA: hypothetical protein VFE20_01955, partial [Thermoleophilia bacterium]|nr:hypothetical protein [Thermoleophilia bacterium]